MVPFEGPWLDEAGCYRDAFPDDDDQTAMGIFRLPSADSKKMERFRANDSGLCDPVSCPDWYRQPPHKFWICFKSAYLIRAASGYICSAIHLLESSTGTVRVQQFPLSGVH